MSHFIALRQRLKVIESIKKTTGAMRLISMSTHSRLKYQKNILEEYVQYIKKLLEECQAKDVDEFVETVSDEIYFKPVRIAILVGTQKGLCGQLNAQLFQFFAQHMPDCRHILLIAIGKYAYDYCKERKMFPYKYYAELSATTFVKLADQLVHDIVQQKSAEVIVFNNVAQTFFIQQPQKTVIKYLAPSIDVAEARHAGILPYLNELHMKSTLLQMLYESLLAEQAARFISMDSAYRNADEVLNRTRLDYNKMRQAYVTRELTELVGGVVAQE